MENQYQNNINRFQSGQAPVQASVAQGAQLNQTASAPANYRVPPVQSASGVNIQIISPSVYGQGGGAVPPLYPYNPIYSYPQAPNITNNNSNTNYGGYPPVPQKAPAPPAPLAPVAEEKKKTKKKSIVPLTNEYIKTLENYLNNPNEHIRVTGIKEVMNRFKDDDSRKGDAALTALMNKALQDESSNVRALAMTIPAVGYASGDAKTVQILNELQKTKSNYNEDALLASQALMKLAANANKVEVEVPDEG